LENASHIQDAGDHDFPPHIRATAVEWFRYWIARSDELK